MMRCRRAAPGVLALACLLPGCGSSDPGAAETAGEVAGPTQRVLANKRFEDPALKRMLEKGVRPNWSPDMLKSNPAGKSPR